MLQPRWIIGFAGHRVGVERVPVEKALCEVLPRLREAASEQSGAIELHGSAALGADLLVVDSARQFGLPVHLILPLTEEEFRQDFEGHDDAWSNATAAIERARARTDGGSLRCATGSRTRPDCYFDASLDMLRRCDLLIAVWNGQPSAGVGGTADAVAQARAEDIPVVIIEPVTGRVDWSELSDTWPDADPVVLEVNRWLAECGESAADFSSLARQVDDLASHHGRRFRPAVVLAIALHGLAALVAAATAVWTAALGPADETARTTAKPILAAATAIELIMVLLALGVVAYQLRVGLHHRWLRTRFAAELMRGLMSTRGLVDALDPHAAVHGPEWRRFCVSAGLLAAAGRKGMDDWRDLRDAYLKHRIQHQILHFEARARPARRLQKISKRVVVACACAAPLFVSLSLLNKLENWHLEYGVGALAVLWMPIALPLVAGIASAWRAALDMGRRSSRYPAMMDRLRFFERRLKNLQTRASVEATVRECEEVLVDENFEWLLAMHEVEAL